MRQFRRLIHARPVFALFVLAMALCVKALLPSGYMVSAGTKSFTVGLCSDGIGIHKTTTITVPVDPTAPTEPAHQGKTDGHCAFSALSMAATSGADAPLLALALVFVLAIGLLAQPTLLRANPRGMLPPSQGPPARA
jgi:hypothetical protein